MTRNQQIMCLAVAMLASWSGNAQAALVVETVPSNISLSGNGSVTFNFPALANANQLVSISGGSVQGPEGGVFNVAVNYAGGSTFSLSSGSVPSFPPFNFSSIANVSFPVGTVNGVTFTVSPGGSGFLESLTIPAGTTFTFNTAAAAVPEPASWALMLIGFGALGYSLRQRRKALPAAA